MPKSKCPIEILNGTKDERLQFYKDYTVAHPHLKKAVAELTDIIRDPAGSQLATVFGPTGVGKSKMKEIVLNRIIEQNMKMMEQDPGYIPIATMRLVPPDSGKFKWNNYFIRALLALNEPMIEKKVIYKNEGVAKSVIPYHKNELDAVRLRLALEQAFKYRRPRAFLIDEAQYFSKASSGRRILEQLDIIKSLAEETETLHIIIGTYELLDFRDLNGQLSRRNRDIHISRYRADNIEELEIFKKVLAQFQLMLPLEEIPDLVSHWRFFYERTVGCIGILKDWLYKGLERVLSNGETRMTIQLLEEIALTVNQCEKIAIEAFEGEGKIAEDENKRRSLIQFLRIPEQQELMENNNQNNIRRTNGKVGERSPQRDPIGVESM